jgi:capsular polysaccharide biosynthesis protein/Mrp family chromosome partitioning ATPase
MASNTDGVRVSDILATRQAVQSSAAEEAPSLVQAIWKRRWIMLLCVILFGAGGAVLSSMQSASYTASTRVFLSATTDFDPLETGQFVADPGRYSANQVTVMTSSIVLQKVIDGLKLDTTVKDLAETVKVEANADSDVLIISATDSDPAQAAKISDSIASTYQAVVRAMVQERAQNAVGEVTSAVDRANIAAAAEVYGNGVQYVEPADVPESASSPNPVRDGLVLAIVGALIAAAWALYTQSWSKRRVGPAEASAIFSAPILSEIPDRGRVGGPDEIAAAHSDPGDAYRMAAVGLDYIRGTAPGVFLVTSPHAGAGSSTTAINLAAAAADHGRRAFVIAIEDGTRPWPGENDQRPRVLLHDLTQGRVDVAHVMESREASRARFGVIRVLVVEPVQGHPVGDVQRILDQLPDDTDLVVIDAPPLPNSSASFVLAGQVDAVLVVVDETTTPADLEELQRRCRLAGVTVAGLVRNHIRRAPRKGRRSRASAPVAPIRSKHSTPQMPIDSTAPRGLPILTGGMPMGDGGIHLPYGGAPGPDGAPQLPTVAVPQGPRRGPDPGPPQGRPMQGQPPQHDLPWSSVTRIGGQPPVNGRSADYGPGRGDAESFGPVPPPERRG